MSPHVTWLASCDAGRESLKNYLKRLSLVVILALASVSLRSAHTVRNTVAPSG